MYLFSVSAYSHSSTLMGALDTPDGSSPTSNPPPSLYSPPTLPSSLPPARPGRPRPPLPTKSPPLPLVSSSNSISGTCTESAHQNTLPPPLSPTLVSSPLPLTPQPTASTDQSSSKPPSPAQSSSEVLPPPDSTTSPFTAQLTPTDRLVGSSSVWQPKGLSEDQIMTIMEQATAGVCPKCDINN